MKSRNVATLLLLLIECQEIYVIQNDIMVLNMIKCHLSKLMGERKVNIADVSRATGLHRNTISLLYKETATRIDLVAIEKLCEFFDCNIEDLFQLNK